jgi:hypothetical protein
MKRLYYLVICIFFLLSGCSGQQDHQNEEAARFSGLVYSLEDNRVLIVQDLDHVNIPWTSWFEQGKRAVSFSITEETQIEIEGEEVEPTRLARGQQVEVWHSGALAESYPEQGSALKIIILDANPAEEFQIDSGRFSGLTENNGETLFQIKISGVPDELPPRAYRLTDEAWVLFEQLKLEEDAEILFYYLEDQQTDGLIYDLSALHN